MPRLADNTVVWHPVTGERTVLLQGQPLPGWAEGVVNEHLLEADAAEPLDPAAPADPVADAVQAARLAPDAEALRRQDDQPAPDPVPLVEPPRAGKGSSRDAWAAYAATLEVDATEDMGRDDIIAAIEAAQP